MIRTTFRRSANSAADHDHDAAAPRSTAAERGMVTVELAFGMVIVVLMMAVFGWAILLFGVQIACVDTARDVARQAARGDRQAVQRAEDSAPRGARVTVADTGDQVEVTVRATSHPFDFVPEITLQADATALKEPGQ